MDPNIDKSIIARSGNDIYNKITLTDKSKFTLVLRVIIISLCSIYFPLESILDSRLEEIEITTFLNKRNQLFIQTDFYQKFVHIITTILGTNDFIMIYISIVYIIGHPFIGLKLMLVCCFFQYIITILQIIYQANRPFWNSDQVKTICNNSYPNPCSTFFFCCFYYIYCFLSFNMFNKKKFQNVQKIILLVVYLFYISILYFLFITSYFLYHHQIVFNIVLSAVVLVLLISFDTKIYNFIFKFLKNLYNTRVYKMKILYFVIGLFVIEFILLAFFEESDMNKIKDNLMNNPYCNEYKIETLGTKAGVLKTSFLASLAGAFWGAAYTVEKKVGKWWNRDSKKNVIIKIFCTLIVCGAFIALTYILTKINDNFDVYLSLKAIANIFESYCIFGLLPLLFQKLKINDTYVNQSYEKINLKLTNDEDYQIFSKSIFTNEQKNKNDIIIKPVQGKEKEKEDSKKEKKEKKIDDENKNLIEDQNKKRISIENININDSTLSIDEKEEEENKKKENKNENENDDGPISMIINNLVEIKEEEGDLEFNIDNDKENKHTENIDNLKEGLINKDDESFNDN